MKNLSNNLRTEVLIDWLQVYCIGTLKKSNKFTIKELGYGTKVFISVYEIYVYNELVATLACNPRSSALNQKGALIKLKNSALYCDNRIELMKSILDELGYEFKSISRLDLCIDCNHFNNNYEPENFIKDYLQLKITKKGKNKATCHFWQSEQIEFQTLRFGKNSSNVSFYLYNKTQEMKDVRYKKYIEDNWIKSGLDVKKNVWRLECSLKGNKYKIIDKDTGLIRPVCLDDLTTTANLEGIFFHYYHRNFEFKINTSDKNKSRKKNIKLFNEFYDLKDFTTSFKTDEATRMDKIFIGMMENYNCEIRLSNRYYKEDLKNIILDYAEKKGLLEFYYKKYNEKKDIDLINFDELKIPQIDCPF